MANGASWEYGELTVIHSFCFISTWPISTWPFGQCLYVLKLNHQSLFVVKICAFYCTYIAQSANLFKCAFFLQSSMCLLCLLVNMTLLPTHHDFLIMNLLFMMNTWTIISKFYPTQLWLERIDCSFFYSLKWFICKKKGFHKNRMVLIAID